MIGSPGADRRLIAHPGIVISTNLGPWPAEGEKRTPWLSDDALRAMGLIDETGRTIIDPSGGRRRRSRAPAPVC